MAQQWIHGTLYRVTGGCFKCDRAPANVPRLNPSDPAITSLPGDPEWDPIPPPPAPSYYEPAEPTLQHGSTGFEADSGANSGDFLQPEDGALLPADKQALIEFADSEFTRFS